ncbi:hypothetical protein OM428_11790 [Enterococcus gallinarum]|nr:hypothetical protein [Enterococcus gallinarum]MCW3745315.1 hypothetical protein [Enterococcus gallinarum]
MKVDKIEYKRVINDAGHLEYDLLQYLEKIARVLLRKSNVLRSIT